MATPTGNQPQVDPKTKVYFTGKVVPVPAGSSNQPQVIPVKIYGVKKT